ncbi:MAG: hypothetical protein RI973_1232 [Bacteroidota bacterium]
MTTQIPRKTGFDTLAARNLPKAIEVISEKHKLSTSKYMSKLNLLLCFLFLTVSSQLSAQTKASQQILEIEQLSDSLYKAGEYAQAARQILKAAAAYEKQRPLPYDRLVSCYRRAGLFNYWDGNFQDSKTYFEKAISLATKHLSANNQETAEAYNGYGVFHLSQGDYNKALEFFKKSLEVNLRIKSPKAANNYNNIGVILENNGEYEEARYHYRQAMALNRNNPEIGFWSVKVADNYVNLGSSNFYIGEYNDALACLDTTLMIYDSLLPAQHPDYAAVYNNIGAVHKIKGDYQKARNYLEKALANYLSNLEENHPDVANVYSNIGDILLNEGDYNRALPYFVKAYAVRVENFGEDHHLVARTCNYLGDCYLNIKKYDIAYNWYSRAIATHRQIQGGDPAELAEYLNDMGRYHEKTGNLKKALEMYRSALGQLNNNPERSDPDLAGTLLSIAQAEIASGQSTAALKSLEKALQINLKIFGKHHQETSKSYLMLAKANAANEGKAMAYCLQAMEACRFSASKGQDFSQVLSPITLLEILLFQGELLLDGWQQSSELPKLKQADQVFSTGVKLIEHTKANLQRSGSRQSLVDNYFRLYEKAILAKFELQKNTGDERYWEEAFRISEQSNATLLLEALLSTQVKNFSDIPDTLISREDSLLIELGYRERQLSEEEMKGTAQDHRKLKSLRDQIFNLQLKHSALQEQMREDYPAYYNLLFSPQLASVSDVQQRLLSKGQTLLSYFTGEEYIFAFLVSKSRFQVLKIAKDFPLEDWLQDFRSSIYQYNPAWDQSRQLSRQFASLGHKLYQELLSPLEPMIKTQRLIIVPGGILGYLPFEALLRSPATGIDNFSSFDFLLKHRVISYANSATLLMELNARKSPWRDKGLVAFAPRYDDPAANAGTQEQRNARAPSLRYNIIESDMVQRLLGGTSFQGSAATLENFRLHAPEAVILHLATHGISDDDFGENSHLIFSSPQDSSGGNRLFVRDLYHMRIQAALVVLSACETGIGELQRGEGIISLSRGFFYAGANSIVTTLWSIDDKASAEIMEAFYANLMQGQEKDEALRNAKLAFLEREQHSGRAHPIYWAAFVPVGNMAALGGGRPWWLLAVAITGILLYLAARYSGRFFASGKKPGQH